MNRSCLLCGIPAGVEADPDLLLHDADAAMYRRKQHRAVPAG